MIRVTLGGGDLDRFEYTGFDQWFRLAIPVRDSDRLDNLPQRFGFGGLLKFMTLPKGTRPMIRNYTLRQYDPATGEIDIDFIVHGTEGVAGPWASSVEPGAQIALIDQGCGWAPVPAGKHLIVADESGMPAALGILRDMPRDADGDAIIELFDDRDRQDVDAPEGMTVHWVIRDPDSAPGTAALPALRELDLAPSLYAFAVGESAVATGVRRHLVNDRGVPKSNVTFCGYWRVGKASPG
ncbi:siderophore-interacting protein [Gordonia crocea]|uniref:Siderophore-interacting protein n=1 Tax=Gordonia crocea TaxID=589162 RepID=A0A7I9UWA2_9ACTN|nr:siderophore-interacting protein [Gordonia crocea]GED97050.1 siderophore-interacting protein [Gordonia crocea]